MPFFKIADRTLSCVGLVWRSEVSLTHTLLGLIRRGGDKEIALACRALGLFCITLGLADGSDG